MAEGSLRATRREWIGLAILALPSMLVTMDLTLLHLAVPHISADLNPSSSQLLWITDIYGFLIAGFLVTMGTLGDRVGRRRLLLLGAAAFGVASLVTAYAQSPEMLILARGALGIAGACLAPSTLSLIRNMFQSPAQRTTAITIWSTSFMLGGALGPVVGGAFLEYFWWGSVFLLALPVMVLLLVLGPILLPEYRNPDGGRVDFLSSLLSLVAVLSVIYGLKEVAVHGPQVVSLLTILAGVVVGYLFVRRQGRLTNPLLNLRLFGNRAFSVSLMTLLLTVLFLMGVQFVIAQFFQTVLNLSPLRAGLWLLPAVVTGMVGALLASVVVTKVRPAYVLGVSMTIAAAGFAALWNVSAQSAPSSIMLASMLMFAGLAPVAALGIDMIVGAAPPEQAGPAAAISETSNEFGGALGIAIVGSISTAVYRHEMADAYPGGVPGGAEDTLVGALQVATTLPAEAGADLTAAAHEAFAAGLRVNSLIAAPLLLLLAVIVTVLLRHLRHTSHEDETPVPDDAAAAAAPPLLEKQANKA